MMEMPPLPPIDGPDVGYYVEETLLAYGESCARMAREEESYIIELLVAAGHVTAEKVTEAREIAAAIRKG